jgi:hypothetical protein
MHRFEFLFQALKDIAEKLPTTNVATLITSFVCIAFLIVGKDYLNPFIQKKLPAPIPFDLIAVSHHQLQLLAVNLCFR